ncbi:MAG: [Fe-S]-binding protein, partial [Desulfobacteraceae bacterium IS3]
CAACLNICPVYRKIGGFSYHSAYPGPVGAVVTPLLWGVNEAKDLCLGETLCGACQDACPVNINIPRMLLALRAKLADGDPRWHVSRADIKEKMIYSAWSWLIRDRVIYEMFLHAAAIGQKFLPKHNEMISRMPPPLSGWTQSRDIRPLAKETFLQRWKTDLD